MKYAFRLVYGQDLRKSIEDFCKNNNISSAAIVTVVGCVYQAKIRLADGKTQKQFNNHYEIISLTGTISPDGSHMHIGLSDINGNCIGGHLSYGCLVNTTAECVIESLDDRYSFSRQYDSNTGYDELYIKEK